MQLTSILYHLSQWLQSPSVKGQSKADWGTWMTSEMEQSLLHNRHCNLQTSPGWSLRTETPSQGKLQDLPLQVPHWEGEPNTGGHNCWLKLGNVLLESRAPRQGTEKSFEGSVVTRAKGWDKRCRACYPDHRTKQTMRLEGKLFLVVRSWKRWKLSFQSLRQGFPGFTHSGLLRSWRRCLSVWTRAGPRTGNLLKLAHWLSRTEIWGLKSVTAPS